MSSDSQTLGEYILGFSAHSAEGEAYAKTHLGRLVRTLQLIPPGTAEDRILEMGAYMQITPALKTKLGYGEARGCYLGPLGKTDQKSITSSTGESFSCSIDLFDAEADPFPYPDAHYATVVCCELLEHLADDPMHMMSELNRILRPGGHLVLSTPNICALRAVAAVLTSGHPGFFAQYIKPMAGGVAEPRHAREYTPNEITALFEASGFHVEHSETGPYGEQRPSDHDWTLELLAERGFSTELRDDVIHAVGKKTGPVRDTCPAWLYA